MTPPEFDAVFFLMCLFVAFGAGWVLKGLCDALLVCVREIITLTRALARRGNG